MKKKATARPAKAISRRSTLNFPTSSDADLIAESTAAETSEKSGAKNRKKRTGDFADDTDKHNETNGDSSVPVSSAPTERNKTAQGKKRSAAALGQHPSITESPEGATEPWSSVTSRRKRTADDADKHNKPHCDSSAISAPSAVKTARGSKGQGIDAEHPSWSNLPLSDLVHSIDQGWSPRCENHAASSHSEWAVIKTTAIQNLQFLDQENKALPSTLEPRKHLELRPGDLLITRAGPRNRVGVACLVRSTRPRLMLCDKAYRLKCRLDVVEPAFLELALNSPDLVSQVNKLKTGINDSGVNITQTPFMNLEIPVPPLPEQIRIVAEIEKQFTGLDAGVAALKRVQANLKRYRAAVLKAACEGKLVPTEAELRRTADYADIADKKLRLSAKSAVKTPPFETGEQLLQRILTERRQNWQGRGQYKEPVLPDSDYLGHVPEGWAVGSISQIAECLDGRRIPINKAERLKRPGAIPYYGANGRVGWIDAHLFDETLVLVVEDETFVGRTLPFSYLINGKSWVNNHAHVLRATLAVQPAYLNYALAYYPFTARTTGSTGRRKLTQQALMGSPFVLPPLAEQTRIVAEVERRLSVVDELEAVVSANLQRSARLRQSILQKAFTGGL